MATGIIPLQPYTQEGQGSAFILPDQNRLSAADVFASEIENRKKRRLADEKMLQDEMINLDSYGAKGLPERLQQFYAKKKDIISKYQDMKMSGGNPDKAGSPENLQLRQDMNSLKHYGSLMSEEFDDYKKNYETGVTHQKDYDLPTFINEYKDWVKKDLSQSVLSERPKLRGVFNPDEYEKRVVSSIPTSIKEGQFKPTGVRGVKERDVFEVRDVGQSENRLFDTGTYEGKKYFDAMYEQGLSKPKVFQQALSETPQYKTIIGNKKNPTQEDMDKVQQELLKDQNALQGFRNNVARLNSRERLQSFYLTKKGSQTERENEPKDGGGKSFDDMYNVVITPYEPTSELAVTLPGQTWVTKATAKGDTIRRVAVERKPSGAGADAESIQLPISGKQVRPISYLVNDNTGEVVLEYSANEKVGEKIDGTPIYDQVVKSKVLDQGQFGNIAARYGFKTVDDFKKNMLKMNIQKSGAGAQGGGSSKTKPPKIDTSKLTGAALVNARRQNKANGY